MAALKIEDTSLSWKGFVRDLLPMYCPGHKRNKYDIWIMSEIAFGSLFMEAAAIAEMWRRNWTGTGLTCLGGG